uniref:HIG1 domain-containing protein n=1 Tax=Bicosoecida sp. CB-2014 TaxID=1486930 RepID=A0A7S1C920_9STRA
MVPQGSRGGGGGGSGGDAASATAAASFVSSVDPIAEAAAARAEAEAGRGPIDAAVDFAHERPLTMAVGLWASLMVGTGLYIYKRKSMSFSQKLIHSRLVAQAGVLTGICSVAIVNVLQGKPPSGADRYDDALALYNKFDRPEFAQFAGSSAALYSVRNTAGGGAGGGDTHSPGVEAAMLQATSAGGAELLHRRSSVKR